MLYLWLKAFHLIFIITWFAGIFYLPRLFVYHADPSIESAGYTRFCIMERKLYRFIMLPSSFLVLFFGLGLIHILKTVPFWLQLKLVGVAALFLYQWRCGWHLKQFAEGSNSYSHRYYRLFNEIPSILLIAMVLLAVLKPV